MAKMNQNERIYGYMLQFGAITTYDAFVDMGCTRLASRICDIVPIARERGYNIKSEYVESQNRFGEPVRYKRYWLEKIA